MDEHNAADVAGVLRSLCPTIVQQINEFAKETLKTRGGRIGSGMGTLLEALWGYYANKSLGALETKHPYEIGWMASHDYNDFACIRSDGPWNPVTREGEILRIEVKSMNQGADESKAHFDELVEALKEEDLLLVLVWAWLPVDELRSYPGVADFYIGPAREVALLRDALHLQRGGSFVNPESCPDGCAGICTHKGEPLNAMGNRERVSGPTSKKPANTSFAANFGGLVRMLKTASPAASGIFKDFRKKSQDAHEYISFIHRNYPKEEQNSYKVKEWKELALALGIEVEGKTNEVLLAEIRKTSANYRDVLRALSSGAD